MSEDDKPTSYNISRICRTCLQHYEANSLLSLNEIYIVDGEIRLIDVFLKYTELKENENYPQKICADCILKAEAAYSFFAKCNESELILSQLDSTNDQEADLELLEHCRNDVEEFNPQHRKFEIITLINDENQENMEIKIILDEDIKKDTDSEESSQEDSGDEKFTIDKGTVLVKNLMFTLEKCTFCNMELETSYMDEHKEKYGHHESSVMIKCPHCGVSTRNITSFKQHLRNYHNNRRESKKYSCELCNKVFTWYKNFEDHMNNHKLNPEETVVCPECGVLLGNITALQIHKNKEHIDLHKIWTCRHCSEVCKTLPEFKKHLRDIHSEKDFHCIICGKDCEDRRTLYYHEQLHLEEYGIECSYCHKKLLTEEKLILHQRIHKYVNKKHVCTFCNKGFKQLDKLEAHERIHTGEKPFTCEECGKAFNHQNNLMHHKRLHTGDTPYKCLFCSKEFSNSHSLRKHMNECSLSDETDAILSTYLVQH